MDKFGRWYFLTTCLVLTFICVVVLVAGLCLWGTAMDMSSRIPATPTPTPVGSLDSLGPMCYTALVSIGL